jgi:hypothetical protein
VNHLCVLFEYNKNTNKCCTYSCICETFFLIPPLVSVTFSVCFFFYLCVLPYYVSSHWFCSESQFCCSVQPNYYYRHLSINGTVIWTRLYWSPKFIRKVIELSEACLNDTLNKPESCINQTLTEVPNQETCVNLTSSLLRVWFIHDSGFFRKPV